LAGVDSGRQDGSAGREVAQDLAFDPGHPCCGVIGGQAEGPKPFGSGGGRRRVGAPFAAAGPGLDAIHGYTADDPGRLRQSDERVEGRLLASGLAVAVTSKDTQVAFGLGDGDVQGDMVRLAVFPADYQPGKALSP